MAALAIYIVPESFHGSMARRGRKLKSGLLDFDVSEAFSSGMDDETIRLGPDHAGAAVGAIVSGLLVIASPAGAIWLFTSGISDLGIVAVSLILVIVASLVSQFTHSFSKNVTILFIRQPVLEIGPGGLRDRRLSPDSIPWRGFHLHLVESRDEDPDYWAFSTPVTLRVHSTFGKLKVRYGLKDIRIDGAGTGKSSEEITAIITKYAPPASN